MQQYSVSVQSNEFRILQEAGALEMLDDQCPVLRNLSAHQDSIGLCIEEVEVWNVETLNHVVFKL